MDNQTVVVAASKINGCISDGSIIEKPYATAYNDWQYASLTSITTASSIVIKAAGAVNIRNYVTAVSFFNTGTGTQVSIQDGSTVIWAGFANQNQWVDVPFPTPLRGSPATAMNFVVATSGCGITLSAQGYQGK